MEREHISRELHDSVGHGLSVISLHAAVAREEITDDHPAAAPLDQIRSQASSTLNQLRTMLRLLRERDTDGERSVLSLDDIGVLTADLTPAVDAASYRIVQESLTNVLRHSHATRVRGSAHIQDATLVVTVADNGGGGDTGDRSGGGSLGHGVTGMAGRVRVLGGTFTTYSTGTTSPAGFTVTARIPARLEP